MAGRDHNLWHGLGNLTRDPEMRSVGESSWKCVFGVAVSTSYTNREGVEVPDTMSITVEVGGRTGEACAQYLRKGSRVLVVGGLRYQTWTDARDEKRSRHVIRASAVHFLDSMHKDESDPDGVAGEISPPPSPSPLPPAPAPADDEPPF